MAQSVQSFLRKTCVTTGIFNLVLNPFFAWLSNLSMEDVPLAGAAVDTAITCLAMAFLISLFISAETRRALTAGSLATEDQNPRIAGPLHRLPGRPWQLGLVLGLAAALVVTPWLMGLFSLFGVSSFSFFAFVLLKAVYTPLAAYALARLVILRRLVRVPE
jgi:hypothetical protein